MKLYKVHSGQNMIDVAIATYGSVKGLVRLARDNGLAVDASLETNQELMIDESKVIDKNVLKYLNDRNIVVNTGEAVIEEVEPIEIADALFAYSINSTTISLSWIKTTETPLTIERSLNQQDWIEVESNTLSDGYNDQDLIPNTTYYYRFHTNGTYHTDIVHATTKLYSLEKLDLSDLRIGLDGWYDPRIIDYKTNNARIPWFIETGISEFIDRSGKNNSIVQTDPSKQPEALSDEISFDGAGDSLVNIEVKTPEINTLFMLINVSSDGYGGSYHNIVMHEGAGQGGFQHIFTNTDNSISFNYSNNDLDEFGIAMSFDGWNLITIIKELNHATFYLNGVQVGNVNGSQLIQDRIHIGSWNGNSLKGSVKDIIKIHGAISDTERQWIEAYVCEANGLKSLLPIGHPFKNSTAMFSRDNFNVPLGQIRPLDVPGFSQTGIFISGDFMYPSSIDPIPNLFGRYCYDSGAIANLPIVVFCHGWTSDAGSYTDEQIQEYAAKGYFVCAFGMRGKDGANGASDAGGREVVDVYDGLQYVKANFSNLVNIEKVCLIGFSAGGGIALNFACKYPDYVCSVISYYGVSDYGSDSETSWRVTNPSYAQSIIDRIGDPISDSGSYMARNTRIAIGNYQAKVMLFHNPTDGAVHFVHSDILRAKIETLNIGLLTMDYDSEKFNHGNYNNDELDKVSAMINESHPWRILPIGQMTVIGFLKTKRFEIWLGNGDDHAVTVDFDVIESTYHITPLTGSVQVSILQYDGNKIANQIVDIPTTIEVM